MLFRSAGFLIALVFPILLFVLLWYTQLGAHIRATGLGYNAARYSGIKTDRAIFISFMLGGAVAGAAGVLLTAGSPLLGAHTGLSEEWKA